MKKTCSKCNIEKELHLFEKHNKCKYGVHSICKICKNPKQEFKNSIVFICIIQIKYLSLCLESTNFTRELKKYLNGR